MVLVFCTPYLFNLPAWFFQVPILLFWVEDSHTFLTSNRDEGLFVQRIY